MWRESVVVGAVRSSVVSRSAVSQSPSLSTLTTPLAPFPFSPSAWNSYSALTSDAVCGPLRPPPFISTPIFQLAASRQLPSAPPLSPPGVTFSPPAEALVALLAAVVAACLAGFLVAVREMVRACREATLASRAVSASAESIVLASAALRETLVKADALLDNVENLGTTTASVLQTATREAGVLQRRLSDLPNTASRTLMEAITNQYASSPRDGDTALTPPLLGSVSAGGVPIEIGAVVEGARAGARWLGGSPGCNFTFNRANRFRTGEV